MNDFNFDHSPIPLSPSELGDNECEQHNEAYSLYNFQKAQGSPSMLTISDSLKIQRQEGFESSNVRTSDIETTSTLSSSLDHFQADHHQKQDGRTSSGFFIPNYQHQTHFYELEGPLIFTQDQTQGTDKILYVPANDSVSIPYPDIHSHSYVANVNIDTCPERLQTHQDSDCSDLNYSQTLPVEPKQKTKKRKTKESNNLIVRTTVSDPDANPLRNSPGLLNKRVILSIETCLGDPIAALLNHYDRLEYIFVILNQYHLNEKEEEAFANFLNEFDPREKYWGSIEKHFLGNEYFSTILLDCNIGFLSIEGQKDFDDYMLNGKLGQEHKRRILGSKPKLRNGFQERLEALMMRS